MNMHASYLDINLYMTKSKSITLIEAAYSVESEPDGTMKSAVEVYSGGERSHYSALFGGLLGGFLMSY